MKSALQTFANLNFGRYINWHCLIGYQFQISILHWTRVSIFPDLTSIVINYWQLIMIIYRISLDNLCFFSPFVKKYISSPIRIHNFRWVIVWKILFIWKMNNIFFISNILYTNPRVYTRFLWLYTYGEALGKRNLFFYNEKLCLSERKREREIMSFEGKFIRRIIQM